MVAAVFGLALLFQGGGAGGGGCVPAGGSEGLPYGATEYLLEAGSTTDKIVVVDIAGVILEYAETGLFQSIMSPVDNMRIAMANAEADPNVKGMLIRVNSPGGGVTASDLIYREIEEGRARIELSGRSEFPIAVVMGDLAASGGYYVSAPADQIFAQPTTLTGSIGVIMSGLNYAGLMARFGVSDATVTSTPFKDIGSPYRAPAPFEDDAFRGLLDQMHETFVDRVFDGRSRVSPALTRAEVESWANGLVYTAEDALALGLIDQIGYEDDAIAWLDAKIDPNGTAQVVLYQQEVSFFDLLGVQSGARLDPQVQAAAVRALIADQMREAGANVRMWALWRGPGADQTVDPPGAPAPGHRRFP